MLRPGVYRRDTADGVLRGRDDEVPPRESHADLRLPQVYRTAARAGGLAAEAGIGIGHIGKKHVRQEAVVAKVPEQRGGHPGLVHIVSAMEGCATYKPWHDKQTHKTDLRPDTSQCLHNNFYFIDAGLGLIHLRVPTWAPCQRQLYCNGNTWLARQLTADGIAFTVTAFARVADWQRARDLAGGFSPDELHRVLDRYATLCCPVLDVFGQTYHWSPGGICHCRSARALSHLRRHRGEHRYGSSHGEIGGGFAKASVRSRSSQDGKIK